MPLTTSPEKTDGGRGDPSVGLAGAKPIASVPVPTGGRLRVHANACARPA